MKSTWTGLAMCALVIYFGIVHAAGNPWLLLNAHAIILVCGGTVAISFLTYSWARISEVLSYIVHGFLFRAKKSEADLACDLITYIDSHYQLPQTFSLSPNAHPFLIDAYALLHKKDVDYHQLEAILMDRRNSIKRKYMEDAKILNNIAKYPPHLGLLGAASGMIEMMSGLGKDGIDRIGASMAVALSATLWGVALNNFVFLPLADNSMKAAEDELFMRDMIIECHLMMKKNVPYNDVISSCLNKLSIADRAKIRHAYVEFQKVLKAKDVA